MITHAIPYGGAAHKTAPAGVARTFRARGRTVPGQPASDPGLARVPHWVNQGRYGPLRVPLHLASRCQGASVDPGAFPLGARARRLRGALLLSHARPAC